MLRSVNALALSRAVVVALQNTRALPRVPAPPRRRTQHHPLRRTAVRLHSTGMDEVAAARDAKLKGMDNSGEPTIFDKIIAKEVRDKTSQGRQQSTNLKCCRDVEFSPGHPCPVPPIGADSKHSAISPILVSYLALFTRSSSPPVGGAPRPRLFHFF